MNLRRTSKRFNGLVAIDIHCGNAPDAIAINDSGQVVGSSVLPNGEGRAFLWDAGSMRDLGTLGGDWSAPSAVSATGQVVGQSTVIRGAPDRHAFLWENGVMRDLGTLGGSASGPGGTGSINDAGETVGASETALGELHAVLWRAGNIYDLGSLGVPYTSAVGINDAHQIFGTSSTYEGRRHAFVFDPNKCPVGDAASRRPW